MVFNSKYTIMKHKPARRYLGGLHIRPGFKSSRPRGTGKSHQLAQLDMTRFNLTPRPQKTFLLLRQQPSRIFRSILFKRDLQVQIQSPFVGQTNLSRPVSRTTYGKSRTKQFKHTRHDSQTTSDGIPSGNRIETNRQSNSLVGVSVSLLDRVLYTHPKGR